MDSIDQTSISQLEKRFAAESNAEDAAYLTETLLSFSKYASAIYELEVYMLINGKEANPDEHKRLDDKRSHAHDSVISHLEGLAGFCRIYDIPPVYSGALSRERPYRVDIADAVLAYVNDVLEKRVR